ncbi:transcriptional regulator domain-containing protein [Eilatimonas milleporae]|uniref:Transcriptional regulator-like domain-containing protein n=1 Tax=Eilatimonas milleporae TaxID=911205 RepID=A0A3M0BZG5_9PROT|nr:hypothetical protein BXY39_3485 [Eilatimonas milleporae]
MLRDWSDDRAYDHFDSLDLSGLAWECLRRNEHYRADYGRMSEGGATAADWGLRFPRRPGHRRTQRSGFLAARLRPRSRQPGRQAAGLRAANGQHHRARLRASNR